MIEVPCVRSRRFRYHTDKYLDYYKKYRVFFLYHSVNKIDLLVIDWKYLFDIQILYLYLEIYDYSYVLLVVEECEI